MKVVLDTNVVVSGLINKEGACGHILSLLFAGLLQPGVDDRIVHEYETVLARPLFRILPDDAQEALRIIRLRAERAASLPLRVALPDPSDLPFLEVAAAAEAILVTGNARHFPRHARAGVTVMTPKDFLDLLRGSARGRANDSHQ